MKVTLQDFHDKLILKKFERNTLFIENSISKTIV